MEMNIKFDEKDEIVMKLLHYFITEKNYNPVILYGAKDEIWLENMETEYTIVRIVSNYIHNDEQLDYDLFRTSRIVKDIKKKTFKFKLKVLSIFVNLGDNANLKQFPNIDCVDLTNDEDLNKYKFIYEAFPDIDKKLVYNEKGLELFIKITDEINAKNKQDAEKIDKLFKPKKPIATYTIIAINVFIFLFGLLFNLSDYLIELFALYGPYVKLGDYYRLISSCFIHASILHIFFNMYSLYVIGKDVESFFGKTKFIIIYLYSALIGSLLSMLLNINSVSVGASGAIFGLLGALLYFGYYYRVYLGNTVTKQILPVILINLLIGFSLSGIDNFAHIGGLVGGITSAMALGVTGKSDNQTKTNGIVFSIIILLFLIFMNFIYAR